MYDPYRGEVPAYLVPAIIPINRQTMKNSNPSLPALVLHFPDLICLNHKKPGPMIQRVRGMRTKPNPKVTPMARPICPPRAIAPDSVFSPTRERISERMKATTSSITAAPSKAVPNLLRLMSNPKEGPERSVRTVPREVEERAAPAANEWSKGKLNIGVRRNERAMGTRRPLSAIHVERGRRPVRVDNEVALSVKANG